MFVVVGKNTCYQLSLHLHNNFTSKHYYQWDRNISRVFTLSVIVHCQQSFGIIKHAYNYVVVVQICTSATINNRNSSIAEDDATDNNNDEGRDSPSTGTQESGYGSTCTDSLGYRDTDNDLDTCDTGDSQDNINHNQSQNRDRSLVSDGTRLFATFVLKFKFCYLCFKINVDLQETTHTCPHVYTQYIDVNHSVSTFTLNQ